MWYKIERYKNQFIITNTSVSNLYLSLYVSLSCNRDENYKITQEVSEIFTAPNTNYTFSLPIEDGLYKLLLTDKLKKREEILIPQYSVLLSSLIADIDYVLCGCHCANCNDCNEEGKDVLSTVLKVLAYNTINNSKYSKNIASANKCVECEVFEISQCNIINENVTGNVENTLLLKKLIAYYYLVYYSTDLRETSDINGTKYIYNYSKIYPCIKKYLAYPECISFNLNNSDSIDASDVSYHSETVESALDRYRDEIKELQEQTTNITLQNVTDKGSVTNKSITIARAVNEDQACTLGQVKSLTVDGGVF